MKTRSTHVIAAWVLSALLSAVAARAATVTVGDYAALTNAIAVCADGDTISLTTNITVYAELSITTKGLTFEGNHHTISVPVPSLDESGVMHRSAPSDFRVFYVSSGGRTNTIRNLTIKGGSPASEGGGISNVGGTLVLEGVTVTQSGGPDYGGGGIANGSGTLFMRDCMISRNIAKDGGGFHNIGAGAKIFVERCTLSDNRCMSGWGGGAVENGSALYVNNSTFAANECNELGGAINNVGGIAYFVGCTFVGNMASGNHEGGAIAHNGGNVTLVNSLFAYNYHNSDGTYLLNDITSYSGTPPVAYGCVFQSTTNQLGASSFGTHLYTGNATGSDDTLFSGGTDARVLQVNGMEEGAGTFYQPILWKSGVEQTATTAMKGGGFAVGKGVRAAFSSATATPVVGYFNGSAWVTLSGSNPASYEVTTDQNGVDRAGSLIVGAAVSNVIDRYRLKVTASNSGTVLGGTIYGDTYPGNTLVMLTAIPFPGYKFSAWDYVLGGSGVASSVNPFAVSLTTNVTLLPVFAPSAPAISVPPTNQVLATGGTLVLRVTAISVGTQHYQWLKNGGMVSGATNRTLTLVGAAVTDTGVYSVVISNAHGMSISTPVTVTVGTPLLLAWGHNYYGQLGDGAQTDRHFPIYVASNVVAAAAGETHSLYLKGDGTLWAMGQNNYGQLGDGTSTRQSNAVCIASNVVAVAAGADHSLYLKGDGALWATGWNNDGELGDGTRTQRNSPIFVASNVVAMAGGAWHSFYVKNNGTLWAMGQNNFGQLGDGTLTSRSNAVCVASNVVAAAGGLGHSLFLKSDATLWAMGWNNNGQLGDGTTIERHVPVSVASNVVTVVGGYNHSLYLEGDGTLRAMGQNDSGQLGDGTLTLRANPLAVTSNATAIAAGQSHSVYLKKDGTLWAMGHNSSGQLGDGTTIQRDNPVSVSGLSLASVFSGNASAHTLAMGLTLPPVITNQPASRTVLVGSNVVFSITATGFAPLGYQWYFNAAVISGATVTNFTLTGVTSANAGNYTVVVSNPGGCVTSSVAVLTVLERPIITTAPTNHVVAVGGQIQLNGAATGVSPLAYQWFKNGGMLPYATNSSLTRSSAAVSDSGVYYLVITNAFGLCISTPVTVTVGTPQLLAWGKNNSGQLGDGTTTDRSNAVSVASHVVAASPGAYHSLFVKGDGTLWAMGEAGNGQLGVWPATNRSSAIFVTNHVVAVAGGFEHSLFVKDNGTLWAMGFNLSGQLGDGTLTSRSAPVSVASNVVTVAAGNFHSLFLKRDGTLWATGNNQYGQLGDGATISRSNAVCVASNVVSMVAGGSHSLYLKSDGTLWGMGLNTSGELGDGKWTTSQSNAVFVASNVTDVAAGSQHSLFAKNDGTAWSIGANGAGQLGNGSFVPAQNSPGCVASNVTDVAAGAWHSLTLHSDGSLWAMGQNTEGQLGNGTKISSLSPMPVSGMSLASIFSGSGTWHSLAIGETLPLTITGAPLSQIADAGSNVTFTVVATGFAPLNYQWYFNNGVISGATATNYTLPSVTPAHAGNYTAVVSNPEGCVTSSVAVLTVNLFASSVTVSSPTNTSVYGDLVTFTASVAPGTASGTVTFKDGATTLATGTLTNGTVIFATRNLSAGGHSIIAEYNGDGDHAVSGSAPLSQTIAKAVLTVDALPQTRAYGVANPELTFTLSGYVNGEDASVVTGLPSLTTSAASGSDVGVYAVDVASGTLGAVNYRFAYVSGTLTISKAPASVFLHGLSQTYDGSPKPVTATTVPEGRAVLLTYEGSAIAPTAPGSYAVTGTVNEVNWQGSTSGTLTVAKMSQTISFAAIAPQPVAATVSLAATASSGLPVSFNVLSGSGAITGNTNLTFSAAGIVIVAASQAGDAVYGAAPNVTNLVFVYTVIPDNGPFVGGNAVTITSGNPGTIASVQVGGVSAVIQGVGTNSLTLTIPAIGSAGIKDIVVRTSDNGDFTLIGAYTVNPAGSIGKSTWVPSGWEGFGSGISGSSVTALALDGENLFSGGDFTTVGGVAANRVACWSGSSWTNLSSGLSGSAVYALVHEGANLYAGGDFTNAGGVVANNVALWNGTVWTNLGSGMNGTVRALALDGQNLYAGGTFTTAGGVAANYVAMWNGTVWTNLDSGVNSWVRALAHDGTNLYVGGYFTAAGTVEANHVARWNDTSWEALGDGLNNDVRALTIIGTNLVAGGDFTTAGDKAANAVALWNGTSWEALGSGMNDSVTSLTQDGVNLYAGGFFTVAGETAANYVAMWDGTSWQALGNGMNSAVKALVHDGVDLVAGGDFTVAGEVRVNRVGVWGETLVSLSGVQPSSGALAGGCTVTISGANLCNGSDAVSVTLCGVAASIQSQSATQIVVTAGTAVTTGLGDVRIYSTHFGETVRTDAFTYLVDQTVNFTAIAPQPRAATVHLAATASSGLPVSFRIVSGPGAIADNTNLTFSAAGMVVVAASQAGDAIYGPAQDVIHIIFVYTVIPDNGPFAGGNAVTIYSGYSGMITNVYMGGATAAIQETVTNGLVLTMPSTGSTGLKDIVVQTTDYGAFTLADAYTVNPAGQIGGSTPGPTVWAGLGSSLPSSAVYALSLQGTNLFVGGILTLADESVANVALWDGLNWTGLSNGVGDTVTALAYDGTNLYAGGYFTTAGGALANYVALWNGTGWRSLGSGLDGPVSTLICDGSNLYAGGSFTTAGGVPANRVAMWNGTCWVGLGSGMVGSSVTALAHDGTNLYAGGDFTKAGGVIANRVAKWNGADWTALSSGMNGTVYALELDGTHVIAGGSFTTAGGSSANRVARWDGSTWTSLGSGMNDTVRALVRDGTKLYAGGYFTVAGSGAANYVALWDGTAWTGLDTGVNSWVRALAHDGTNLYVGGYFTSVGGVEARNVAIWTPTVITHVSVTPAIGQAVGGYQVVISGENLSNGSDVIQVSLCDVSAIVLSQSATQIVVTAGACLLSGSGDVRVYSASYGETVKTNAFTYLPAALIWNPQVQGGADFGVRSNQFGFTISGTVNLLVIVEACTNLANPVWVPLETNTLTDGIFYFSDPTWTNYPARFYHLRQP